MPDFILQGLGVLLVGLTLVLVLGSRSVRSSSQVRRWAEARGFTLLRAEENGLGGPFLLRVPGSEYCSFAVRDGEGKVRTGWLRLPLLGPVDLERVEVRWDPDAAEGH